MATCSLTQLVYFFSLKKNWIIITYLMATAKKSREQSDKYGIRWEQDSDTSACRQCEKKFTTLRRRHHCRVSLFLTYPFYSIIIVFIPLFVGKYLAYVSLTELLLSLSLSLSLALSDVWWCVLQHVY